MKRPINILKADSINGNKRFYSKETIIKMVDEFNKKKEESPNFCLGCLGYPESIDTSLSMVSHVVTNIYLDGDLLKGEIRILKGKYEEIVKEGLKTESLVLRPRSMGTVNKVTGEITIEKVLGYDLILAEEDSFKEALTETEWAFRGII